MDIITPIRVPITILCLYVSLMYALAKEYK